MSRLKKCIAAILIAAILIYLAGCAGSVQTAQPTQAAAATQTAATTQNIPQTARPSSSILPSVFSSPEPTPESENQAGPDGLLKLEPGHVELKPNTDYHVDLDNNGVQDTFSVHDKRESEASGICHIVLAINKNEYNIDDAFGIGQIFLVINENLMPVLIINNDGSSDDYYCWSIPINQLILKDIYPHEGEVIDINANTIKMNNSIYVLGTYFGQSTYTLNEKGELVPLINDTWHFTSGSLKPLTLKMDLSVEIKEGNVYHSNKIKTGKKIWLTSVRYLENNRVIAFFKTENGQAGKFSLKFNKNEFKYYINNINEEDLFVSLPYSG